MDGAQDLVLELMGCDTRTSGFSINHRDLCPYLGLAGSGVASSNFRSRSISSLNRNRI
jgi:hypothetical protein